LGSARPLDLYCTSVSRNVTTGTDLQNGPESHFHFFTGRKIAKNIIYQADLKSVEVKSSKNLLDCQEKWEAAENKAHKTTENLCTKRLLQYLTHAMKKAHSSLKKSKQ